MLLMISGVQCFMTAKSELRKKHKNIRNNISGYEREHLAKVIMNHIIDLKEVKDSQNVFVYCSYGREVSTDFIINKLFEQGKTVLIPKCNTDAETMVPVIYDPNSDFVENVYGIKEIDNSDEYTGNIDVAIVPGVAFDIYGNRLGQGKGYYDKFFKNHNLYKIGVCYSKNLSAEELPHTDNDIAMDCIVSDSGVLIFKSRDRKLISQNKNFAK